MPDARLDEVDFVVLNLTVARGIRSLETLDIGRYVHIVDEWTAQFANWLSVAERRFETAPWKWKNDVRFFRVGMLQLILASVIGIRYAEQQRSAKAVWYTNPSDLFLNGIIDTKRGTCANMAALHVAMARRLRWPVSLASAGPHLLSRFDDGEVVYNIETTSTLPGSFCSEPDDFYISKYRLSPRALESGSDLRKLTARESLALFVALRARHYADTRQSKSADADYALSRALFPNHRNTYVRAVDSMLTRGLELFDVGEVGRPGSLEADFNKVYNGSTLIEAAHITIEG